MRESWSVCKDVPEEQAYHKKYSQNLRENLREHREKRNWPAANKPYHW
jgi:hypothetical protein